MTLSDSVTGVNAWARAPSHAGAPQAEADAKAKILVNQSLSDATYLLVHCYSPNGVRGCPCGTCGK